MIGRIITIVLIILLAWVILNVYNKLIKKDTAIQVQQGQLSAVLQKRNDLVAQLSTLTQRASEFEGHTQISSAMRRTTGKNNNPNSMINATSEMYPELNSIKSNYSYFQVQITNLEFSLNDERQKYNELVGEYKVYVRTFPINIFASVLGYSADRYPIFTTEEMDKPEFWEEDK